MENHPASAPATESRERSFSPAALVGLIRPRHWVKNSLVFVALIFSQMYTHADHWVHAALAFAAFSLTASAVYAINDVLDADSDRRHPVKRNRPVASGQIGVPTAVVIALVLFAAGSAVSLSLGVDTLLMTAGYALVMLLYSVWLKHVMLLDVFIIAAGLTLRAIYGAAAIDVAISSWLLICAFLISLMLALVKRREELARIGGDRDQGRPSLREAPPVATWDHWVSMVAGITILAYILYTVDAETVARVGSTHLLYTTPFVIYAMFRYMARAQRDNIGEDPTDALLRDPGMWVTVLGWLAVVLLVLTGTV
ncbi:MAG: Decaprenyl-phosphate phosphoribosyltransferase [Calditrichaeota bacterium]|nr:Decaprenyl-phosphate phosphoribosyltransferase [Calditrichota bacterium]